MSSGPQACRDDENEWDSFCGMFLPVTCTWSCYSREATLAKRGQQSLHLVGERLVKWVSLMIEIERIEQIAKTQFQEVEKAKVLLKSLGYKITK